MCGKKPIYKSAFSLFELVIVLAIISAMVAVVMPFAKRSNDSLKIKQHSSNVAQDLRYAIDLAQKSRRAVKFIFNEFTLKRSHSRD